MKILAVRIGEKYGPEYETYLEKKLPEYDFHWIREPYDSSVVLQWNKMWVMQLDIDEPICVMDIDVLLINDYKKIFNYPVKRGQFVLKGTPLGKCGSTGASTGQHLHYEININGQTVDPYLFLTFDSILQY